jgi:hypothetical protein
LYLIGYALVLSNPNRVELLYGDPPLLHAVGALSLLIVVLVAGRVHYTLVALAGLAFVWFLYYWNLLEELWF